MTPQSQKDLAALASAKTPIVDIIAEVEWAFKVDIGCICATGGDSDAVPARHAAMYLCHQEGHTWSAIGRAMSRDHSTVLKGADKAKARLDKMDVRYADALNDLHTHVANSFGVSVEYLRQVNCIEDPYLQTR